MVEKVVDLAENLIPIALIGAGGIGKTSIALAVLHHHRIKQRFGNDRRFVRCDEFPASCTHLLRRLSTVIGAEVENPEDLAPLRGLLSSKKMLIVLDNAESILDPQGMDAQEIYGVVEELSQLDNVCLCITSRISTTPPDCETFDIPTLSIEAARDTFYRIYKNGERTNIVDRILGQLDFHPLSITLLATVAHQNKWDMVQLTREWERRRTSMLQTRHNKSLVRAIELSLASLMFRDLGPGARELLEVIAFFPQGVDEKNVGQLFPTIPDGTTIFDTFCVLSLTRRSGGFITMLAPLRDYLSPKDPKSSLLLCAAKEGYFTRMLANASLNDPSVGGSRWITSEDVNVEHLLDVFTTVDVNSYSVWDACLQFIGHLILHKQRPVILRPKIEGLPDDNPYKSPLLVRLSILSGLVGNQVERQRLLTHALRLEQGRGDDSVVSMILGELSDSNRQLGSLKEGIQQAKEGLEIRERLGDPIQQAECLIKFAHLLKDDNQLDAAEEAASRAIDLLPEEGGQFLVCKCHRALGVIYQSKGETEKAIHHLEVALGIASLLNQHHYLFWTHHALADLFLGEGRLDDAHAHIEQAKSHVANSAYNLGRATELQAKVWYKQGRLEEARSEAMRAAEVYEKLGAAKDLEDCRNLLRNVQNGLSDPVTSGQPGSNREY